MLSTLIFSPRLGFNKDEMIGIYGICHTQMVAWSDVDSGGNGIGLGRESVIFVPIITDNPTAIAATPALVKTQLISGFGFTTIETMGLNTPFIPGRSATDTNLIIVLLCTKTVPTCQHSGVGGVLLYQSQVFGVTLGIRI